MHQFLRKKVQCAAAMFLVMTLHHCTMVNIVSAQDIKPSVVLDEKFYQRLQYVYPNFALTTDSVALHRMLSKYYSESSYLAFLADSIGISENPEIKSDLEILTELFRNRFLAEKMKSKLQQIDTTITDENLRKYYIDNIESYQQNGAITYVIAIVNDTTKTTFNKVNERFEKYKLVKDFSESNMSKEESSGFLITAEFDLPFGANEPYYDVLKNAVVNKIYGPIRSNDRFIYILPKKIKPVQLMALDEVQTSVRNAIMNNRLNEFLLKVNRSAITKFPFSLPTTSNAKKQGNLNEEYKVKFDDSEPKP